jgi:hypothetical protein
VRVTHSMCARCALGAGATTEFSGHRAPHRRIPGCFQSESFVQDYESGVRSHQPRHQLRTRLNQRLPRLHWLQDLRRAVAAPGSTDQACT